MKFKENYLEFESEIKNREIEFLIHFTPTINLYSILKYGGLMSRAKLESLDIEQFDLLDYAQFTDDIRYDNKNYINLSISAPNTSLLSRFREKTKDNCTINWCILKIAPKHIYEYDTLFSVTNAASNASKKQFGISGDIQKFKMLFQEQLKINTSNGVREFSREKLLAKYPTDIQAEVLVKDFISSGSIMKVCFENNEQMAMTKAALSDFDTNNFIVEPQIFNPNRYI